MSKVLAQDVIDLIDKHKEQMTSSMYKDILEELVQLNIKVEKEKEYIITIIYNKFLPYKEKLDHEEFGYSSEIDTVKIKTKLKSLDSDIKIGIEEGKSFKIRTQRLFDIVEDFTSDFLIKIFTWETYCLDLDDDSDESPWICYRPNNYVLVKFEDA